MNQETYNRITLIFLVILTAAMTVVLAVSMVYSQMMDDGIDFDRSGWHLLGWTQQQCLFLPDIVDEDGIIESIWTYNGEWNVYDPQCTDFSDLQEICVGEGFWVKVNGTGMVYFECPEYTVVNGIPGGTQAVTYSCQGQILQKAVDIGSDGLYDSYVFYDRRNDGVSWRVREDTNGDGLIDKVWYPSNSAVVK